jgi:hypothetical protein
MSNLDQFKHDLEHSIYGETPAGWRESAISKMCEICWDRLFS